MSRENDLKEELKKVSERRTDEYKWFSDEEEPIESVEAKIAAGDYPPNAWIWSTGGIYKNPLIQNPSSEFWKKRKRLYNAGVNSEIINQLTHHEGLKFYTERYAKHRFPTSFDENGQLIPCPYDIDELIKKHCPEK